MSEIFPLAGKVGELRYGVEAQADITWTSMFTRKASMRELLVTVPQTDTGRLVEYTKVYG